MVTRNAHGPKMIEPITMSARHQYTFVAQRIINLSLNGPFYIFANSFSDCKVRLDMEIAQTTEPTSTIDITVTDRLEAFLVATPKSKN